MKSPGGKPRGFLAKESKGGNIKTAFAQSINRIFHAVLLMLIMASCSDKSGIGSSDDAIQTEHYQFHASKTVPLEIDTKTGQVSTLKLKRNVPEGWKPSAMMIGDTVLHLDKIWASQAIRGCEINGGIGYQCFLSESCEPEP